jgi:hypothetical protein
MDRVQTRCKLNSVRQRQTTRQPFGSLAQLMLESARRILTTEVALTCKLGKKTVARLMDGMEWINKPDLHNREILNALAADVLVLRAYNSARQYGVMS